MTTNDGGGKGSYSWIKYLSLENLNGMLAPLKLWKSDELLMKDVDKEKFVTYNIHKKRFRGAIWFWLLRNASLKSGNDIYVYPYLFIRMKV